MGNRNFMCEFLAVVMVTPWITVGLLGFSSFLENVFGIMFLSRGVLSVVFVVLGLTLSGLGFMVRIPGLKIGIVLSVLLGLFLGSVPYFLNDFYLQFWIILFFITFFKIINLLALIYGFLSWNLKLGKALIVGVAVNAV